MSDDKKVIFSMNKVSKTYQSTGKQVLKDIYLKLKFQNTDIIWFLCTR